MSINLLYITYHKNVFFQQAFSDIQKILPPKTEKFPIKILIFFIFLLQTYIVGRGGSNEYPQSMFFFNTNKKNNVYPCKRSVFFFFFIKVGFKRSTLYRHVFVMLSSDSVLCSFK